MPLDSLFVSLLISLLSSLRATCSHLDPELRDFTPDSQQDRLHGCGTCAATQGSALEGPTLGLCPAVTILKLFVLLEEETYVSFCTGLYKNMQPVLKARLNPVPMPG